MNKNDLKAAIMGSVVADALGVPYEFSHKKDMMAKPATGMTGNGTYNQEIGTWSDDSSLTLACMDSLLNGLNYEDMIRKFALYYFEAAYTPDNHVFDIGNTTKDAINNYANGRPALECGCDGLHSNGNGSLMRIMPIILYLYDKDLSDDKKREIIYNVSALTHAHIISKASCYIYSILVNEILDYKDELDFKSIIENALKKAQEYIIEVNLTDELNLIYNGGVLSLDEESIRGKGYVVNSLNIAIYTCYSTDSYEESVLKAVNFGGDTDTNALITAGLSALYYGYESIPDEWIDVIKRKEYILNLCDKFYEIL